MLDSPQVQQKTHLDLSPILEERIDWRYKSFPPAAEGEQIRDVGRQGWHALDGDLLFPILLIKESALDHNIALMARYAADHGVSLAPHAKTPMAPQIVERQLEMGAWGITVATIHQARVFRALGARRILMANELIEPAGVRWVAREMAADPDFVFYCLVDSLSGVELMEQALQEELGGRPLTVLVEAGAAGGRAGVREREEVLAIAERIVQSERLALAGVEGYEGAISGTSTDERLAAVDRYLETVRDSATDLMERGFFDRQDEVILTAGGSYFFDRVAAILGGESRYPMPVRVVIRSGSYIAHDYDSYHLLSGLDGRGDGGGRLRYALELWGLVLSVPEPDLAIVGFGKRDASYDQRLPQPYSRYRAGRIEPFSGEVTALNDQHAFLRLTDQTVEVGDVLGFNISHPCTTFDKWRLVPLVDDQYRVAGAIRTFF